MVKVKKVTRGYNLSVANVNWLIDQAQKRTREAGNGKTISPNVVLDEILDKERDLDIRYKRMVKAIHKAQEVEKKKVK